MSPVRVLADLFNKRLITFLLLQVAILFSLVWLIAGNDRLFRNTVPIEQRLVSQDESIREKAQQELLGLEPESKRKAVGHLIPALEQEDPFVRKWAAISIALVGPSAQEAIPALLQSVSAKEKGVAQAARVALSEIGAPDAQQLPELLRTLQDPRDDVRCESALSIGKMGPAAREALPILIGSIERRGDTPPCFEEALAAIAPAIPTVVYPRVVAVLGSGHVDLRRKAAHVLAQAGAKTPETINALLDALGREDDSQIRTELAKALQLPGVPEADRMAVLTAALHDDAMPVRLEAARAIRASAPRGGQSLGPILRMLRDPEAQIRRLGLETLRRSGARSPELLRRVAKAQRDNDPGVRCRAAEMLIEYGSADRVSISILIDDMNRDEDTARCAEDVLGLAGLFESDVVRSMSRLVSEDKDPDLRSRAARVLMHLGPRARDAIPALLRAQKDQIPGSEMALRAVRAPFPKRHL